MSLKHTKELKFRRDDDDDDDDGRIELDRAESRCDETHKNSREISRVSGPQHYQPLPLPGSYGHQYWLLWAYCQR